MDSNHHYRVGRRQARNVYRTPAADPAGDGDYIGVMFSEDDSRAVVAALNHMTYCAHPEPRAADLAHMGPLPEWDRCDHDECR